MLFKKSWVSDQSPSLPRDHHWPHAQRSPGRLTAAESSCSASPDDVRIALVTALDARMQCHSLQSARSSRPHPWDLRRHGVRQGSGLSEGLNGPALACLLLGALMPPGAHAEAPAAGEITLYRCGTDGRELRNTPCPREPGASEALRFQPDDALSAQAARERGRQDGQLADRLRHDREARLTAEQQAQRDAAPGMVIHAAGGVTPRASSASSPKEVRRDARTAKSARPRKPTPPPGATRP